jgi:hypothetical protein
VPSFVVIGLGALSPERLRRELKDRARRRDEQAAAAEFAGDRPWPIAPPVKQPFGVLAL